MTKRMMVMVLGLAGFMGGCNAEEAITTGTDQAALEPVRVGPAPGPIIGGAGAGPDPSPDACRIFLTSHPLGTVELTRTLTRPFLRLELEGPCQSL